VNAISDDNEGRVVLGVLYMGWVRLAVLEQRLLRYPLSITTIDFFCQINPISDRIRLQNIKIP
jgi:hypothetical protein